MGELEGDAGSSALFALTFGGIAQFAAGMWSYKARDVVATLAHGTWGAFWIAFGLLNIFILLHKLPAPAPGRLERGAGACGSSGWRTSRSSRLSRRLRTTSASPRSCWTLAAGSALSCVGWFNGGIGSNWLGAGGVLFVISAGLAAYVVLAMCLTGGDASGRSCRSSS